MENKKTLEELGLELGTDKSSLLHNYLWEYEKFFPKPETIKKVVEIGLQRTGKKWGESEVPSVRMWLEFFPNAKVFGFDKQDIKFKDERFEFFRGDQGRIKHHLEFGEMTGDGIDFVIEDCSHRFPHQVLSLLYFYPKLKKGGVYIIEDTKAVVQEEYPENLRAVNALEPLLKTLGITKKQYKWISSESAGEKSSIVIVK